VDDLFAVLGGFMGSTERVPHHEMLEVSDLPPVKMKARHGRGHLVLVSTFGKKAAGARALDALLDVKDRRPQPPVQDVCNILLDPPERKKAGRKRR